MRAQADTCVHDIDQNQQILTGLIGSVLYPGKQGLDLNNNRDYAQSLKEAFLFG